MVHSKSKLYDFESGKYVYSQAWGGRQNCYEKCLNWICDIWCPYELGFILGHENRNAVGVSQEIHRYIQGYRGDNLSEYSREIILHAGVC